MPSKPTKELSKGNQPDSKGNYRCKKEKGGCNSHLPQEEMFIHSSGIVTDFCKKCMSKKRKAGRIKARLKASKPIVARESQLVMISAMRAEPERCFNAEDFKDMGKSITAVRSGLLYLNKKGLIKRTSRGCYQYVPSEDSEISIANRALAAANDSGNLIRIHTSGLLDAFRKMGKTLVGLIVTMGPEGEPTGIKYQAIEDGEVAL